MFLRILHDHQTIGRDTGHYNPSSTSTTVAESSWPYPIYADLHLLFAASLRDLLSLHPRGCRVVSAVLIVFIFRACLFDLINSFIFMGIWQLDSKPDGVSLYTWELFFCFFVFLQTW